METALLEALQLTLSDPQTGEANLHSFEIQSSERFSHGLCAILSERAIDPFLRQLAATVIKKHIKYRWDDLPPPTRHLIKQTLMSTLADPVSKVSGAAGTGLAMLCSKDVDNTALIDGLVGMVKRGNSQDEGKCLTSRVAGNSPTDFDTCPPPPRTLSPRCAPVPGARQRRN